MKTALLLLSAIVTVFGIGCAALSSYITPADIDRQAVRYVTESGIADSNDFSGYGNLLKAERLKVSVDNAHTYNQWELNNLIEKDSLQYARHKGVVANNLSVSQQREEMLFSETGLLSIGLTAAGFGTFTGLLGLMRKRPGDISKEEYQNALAAISHKDESDLSEKENQLVEIVLGVQKFLDTYPDTAATKALKDSFQQSVATKKAVAEIKVMNT